MTNSKQNKGKEEKGGISPVVAAVAGVLAGAGVAIAGAIALSDKNNRDKVESAINNAKNKVTGFTKGVQKQVSEKQGELETKKDKIESKFLEEKENIKVAVIEAVDSLESLAENTKNKVNQTTKIVKDSAAKQAGIVSKEINKTWQK